MSQFKKGLKYFLELTHKNVNGRKLFCLAILIALITMGNLQIMAQEIHYKTQAELEMEYLEKLKTLPSDEEVIIADNSFYDSKGNLILRMPVEKTKDGD